MPQSGARITAAASAVIYLFRGEIDPYVAGPTAIGVFVGATIGSRVALSAPASAYDAEVDLFAAISDELKKRKLQLRDRIVSVIPLGALFGAAGDDAGSR